MGYTIRKNDDFDPSTDNPGGEAMRWEPGGDPLRLGEMAGKQESADIVDAEPDSPAGVLLGGAFAEEYVAALRAVEAARGALLPVRQARRCTTLALHGLVSRQPPGWELTPAGLRALNARDAACPQMPGD